MSILAVFNYNQSQVRTITINNEPWFVAQDVCNILEVKNNRDALSRLDDDEKMELGRESIVGLTDDPNTVRLSAISESGLYSLVLSSRKPEAKPFKRWITHDAKFNNVPETIFKWQTLKAASQKMNLEVKTAPCPRYVTKNLYSHDAWRFCYPSIKLPETTTLVIKHG